ncbi:hypothetical protein NEOLEDRAFT_1137020 [Neolentinus lepideus HHB14362 ss-1]|uniref:DUF952-domain-containing protein n=1 Tax=Neolentinus lepideus HHB14362 ss-1 TaxID=1314782 RepID=A0A165R0H7_9AGAM|nr:hypothetical protein NEOLEDRAFT_1137020 [Neolentinus lepideus HHB14362 ss-1]
MSTNKPTYIYKIVPSSAPPPDPLPDTLPLSELDAKSGFIHFSTAPQVLNTLKFFFKDDSKVYLLRVVYDHVDKDIRWEDPKAENCGPRGGEGMFPHLYNGPKLGKGEVESVKALEKSQSGWDEVVQGAQLEGWLVY